MSMSAFLQTGKRCSKLCSHKGTSPFSPIDPPWPLHAHQSEAWRALAWWAPTPSSQAGWFHWSLGGVWPWTQAPNRMQAGTLTAKSMESIGAVCNTKLVDLWSGIKLVKLYSCFHYHHHGNNHAVRDIAPYIWVDAWAWFKITAKVIDEDGCSVEELAY